MITGFSCVNIFAKNAKDLISFYHDKLGVPILYTLNNDEDGVNIGFDRNAPTICIWDAVKWGSPIQGNTSFVFKTGNLDKTCEELAGRGLVFDPPVRFDWGVYELRLRDTEGNEVVIAEFLSA